MESDELQSLTELTDDELWILLGSEISPGIGPRDTRFLLAAAKAWFQGETRRMQDTLCQNAEIQSLLRNADEQVLLAAVLDLMAPIYRLPSAATVTVLLCRYGLDRLCAPNE